MSDPNSRRADQGGSLISDQMQAFTKWPEKQWAQMADLARPAIKRAARDDKEHAMFEAMCFEVAS